MKPEDKWKEGSLCSVGRSVFVCEREMAGGQREIEGVRQRC